MKRRDFFKLTALASGAAISACNSRLDEKILPYLVPPEDGIIPGEASFVMSTCTGCPANCGVEIKINGGKAVKLEGNPAHPVNRGGLCLRGQASLSKLYHPDRLKTPLFRNSEGEYEKTDWESAGIRLREKLLQSGQNGSRNLLITPRLSGTMKKLTDEFCEKMNFYYPGSIEAVDYLPLREANRIVFDRREIPRFRIGESDLLVTFGADILDTFLSPVEFSKLVSDGRARGLNQWIHIGEVPSLTGFSADRSIVIRTGSAPYLLQYLLKAVAGRQVIPDNIMAIIPDDPVADISAATGLSVSEIGALAASLRKAETPLLIPGGTVTSGTDGILTASLASLLQWKLTGNDSPVDFGNCFDLDSLTGRDSFDREISNTSAGSPGVSLFIDPSEWMFGPVLNEALTGSLFKIALSEFMPPEEVMFDLILPMSDNLESWGDTFSGKGTRSLIQPGIAPQFGTKSPGDMLLWLSGDERSWQNYLLNEWEGATEEWINMGFREEAKTAEAPLLNNPVAIEISLKNMIELRALPAEGNTLFFSPTIRNYDGRDRMLDLLEEVPDPLTTVTYGDHVILPAPLFNRLSLKHGDVVNLRGDGISGEYPAVSSGLLDDSKLILPLSLLKRTAGLNTGEHGGLKTVFSGIVVQKTGKNRKLPRLSGSFDTEGRDILPFLNEGDGHHPHHPEKLHTLFPDHGHVDYRWGMVIDLDACTGCSSCVASCYIENNIPMTGESEHLRGREMSWLRIEPYFKKSGEAEFLPMMCQQCDHAPCETVCPVYATYHNQEGLNAQVYNRCVGTRYCANNCPYKARRFNWFDNERKLPLYGVSNPDLSVRPKGVMEKCTFCIQRIRSAKDHARDQERLAADGEVKPACAQSCPSDAIAFGNLLDPESKVSRLIREKKVYRVHESLGTRPAVYYIKGKKGRVVEHFENKLENDKQ